jgi:hypothetical protein
LESVDTLGMIGHKQIDGTNSGGRAVAKRKKRSVGAAGNTAKKRIRRRAWTKADQRDLKQHSKAKTPVVAISREMKRSVGALRQQALKLGISLGHRR